MIAHLMLDKGRYAWSGHNASGDPVHRPYALVVDVGRDFILTDEGNLYPTGPGSARFKEFSPDGFVLAARSGWFGFRVVAAEEPAAREADQERQETRKLGRRGRIAREQAREQARKKG